MKKMLQLAVMVCSVVLVVSPTSRAQTTTTIPPVYEKVRGNDAMSMPLRWHEGSMQILLRHGATTGVVPKSMVGKALKSVGFRRPAFLEEPAYPGLTRTFTVGLASTTFDIKGLVKDMEANRAAVSAAKGATPMTTVVNGVQFNIAATSKGGYTEIVGKDLLTIPFAAPYLFKGPDLFVDWRTTSSAKVADPHGWVDTVTFANGGDRGLVVTLGQGGCSSLVPNSGLPMTLQASGAAAASSTVTFDLSNAHPDAVTMMFAGFETRIPGSTAPDPMVVTLLKKLARPGCHIWTLPNVVFTQVTSSTGGAVFKIPLPAKVPNFAGHPFVLQAMVAEPSTNLWELTNGIHLLPFHGKVQKMAATVLAPIASALVNGKKVAPTSPWDPMPSTLPILRFAW